MSSSRSVLMVGNFLSGQGRPRGVCEDIALRLTKRDWTVVCTSSRSSRPARLADMLWTVWAHQRLYRVAHVELYSGRAFVWAELVCWMFRKLRKRYIVTLHGGALPSFAADQPGRVERLLRSAAMVTAPSGYLRDRMKDFCSQLCEIPNGVELSRYEWRHRGHPNPVLLWLRAFHRFYNPVMAIQTLSHVMAEFPDASLIMAGPDKGDGSLQECRTAAETLGIAGHVRFSGFVAKQEIPALMQNADIFLNTARVDNTPVTVVEAMACGLCVVSTNAGGVPYLIDDGRDGLLCPSENARAMADAVIELLHNDDLAARLSREGRRKVAAFDWERVITDWERLFLRVGQLQPPADTRQTV